MKMMASTGAMLRGHSKHSASTASPFDREQWIVAPVLAARRLQPLADECGEKDDHAGDERRIAIPIEEPVGRRGEQHEQHRQPRDVGREIQGLDKCTQHAQRGSHGCSFRYRLTRRQALRRDVMTFGTSRS